MLLATLVRSSIELGLLYTLVLLGAWLTAHVIRFDDLTIEGSFACGGALTARLLLAGFPAYITLPVACAVGACTGMATGLLHTWGGLSPFFSGIVVTTTLFSVNLVVATANLTLGSTPTIFHYWGAIPLLGFKMVFLGLIALGVLCLLRWFLTTQAGLVMRATGANQDIVHALGKRVGFFITLALMIANSLHALAGCLFVQYVGFFSIWSGIGILVIAASGILIANMFVRRVRVVRLPGLHQLFGSFVYQFLIALAIAFSPYAEWNNALRAMLLVVLMQIDRWRDHA